MTAWQDAPDASGLWWVRREDHRDVVLQVDVDGDGVWVNRGGEGWCSAAEYPGARWCSVAHPDRVATLESALRSMCDNEVDTTTPWCARCCLAWDDPYHDEDGRCHIGRAIAVLRGATVAGERGSR